MQVLFLQFDRPWWLLLLIPLIAVTLWIGRKTLSGMGTAARRVVLAVRLLVLSLLVMAMADPHYRMESNSVAVTVVLDASRSQPLTTNANAQTLLDNAARTAKPEDLLGLVTTARDAFVQSLPSKVMGAPDIQNTGPTDATNLEAGARLAMAVMPQQAANRILLISDGNETTGSLLAAAKSAQAAKVPIDIIPQRYARDKEVIVERVLAPVTAREGENVKLRILMSATKATTGRLTILMDGQPIDLDPDSDAVGAKIEVLAGISRQDQVVTVPGRGDVRFEAIFEPVEGGDTIAENNRATAVTFVGGEGRVLVLTSKTSEATQLIKALRESGLKTEVRTPLDAPVGLQALGVYEGIVLVNTPASEFSLAQQEELKSYVHDLGGGLVMVGGDESFGAGGWIGSPVAEALPIRLDPPQKRQMPRGALMLVMHSCEMPQGNYWGRRCAEAAIDVLAAKDLAGIVEYSWNGGDGVVHPLSEVGDKSAIRRAANSMSYGDAPTFVTMLDQCYAQMSRVSAGQKHIIIISDGDPQSPTDEMLAKFVAAKISISTVAVFPHSGPGSPDLLRMKRIADRTGGVYHSITTSGQLNTIPQIFMKEAQTVKRSLLWEGEPFSPKLDLGGTEAMKGIGLPLPPITGYVVTADREGLAQVILRGQENDPLLAVWQHGLGRVVAYTSDATSRWGNSWLAWPQYKAFWEQHVRWAMRPAANPNLRVVTADEGDRTRITVEALDDDGARMNFLRWNAAAVAPDGKSLPFDLRQVGPGRYEALVPSSLPGSYTINMGYQQTTEGGQVQRGAVQAAITKPFADEYRALRDNAPLLEQVAKLTGGRVFATFKEAQDKGLWSRDGLTMPVAFRPIWLATALTAIGLFLLDVAIRRVRIDPAAITATVAGIFGKSKSAATSQMGSLQAARERARAGIDQRRGTPGRSPGQAGTATDMGASVASAATKFEASSAELVAAQQAARFASQATGQGGGQGAPIQDKRQSQSGKPDTSAEEGLSRLLKAKKRAQDDMAE